MGDYENPPTDASPEHLIEVCEILKEGSKQRDEIYEQVDISDSVASDVIRYGLSLGFLESEDNDLEATQRGLALTYAEEESERYQELFAEGIRESPLFSDLLNQLIKVEKENIKKQGYLNRDAAVRELRLQFGFDLTEKTLKRGVSTFLQTLEAAGLGKYQVGRGDKPTRLEVADGFLQQASQIFDEENGSSEAEEAKEQPERDQENSADKSTLSSGPPLRISSVRVQNYRNIQDSGQVSLEEVTTLIGKNESGKTSFLEAIESFDKSGEYSDRVLCNQVEIEDKSATPILTLRFEINSTVIKEFYPELEQENHDFPLEFTITKFADGTEESTSKLDLEPPSPEIIYYKKYDQISDEVYIDEILDEENRTFLNLVDIGELDVQALSNLHGLEHEDELDRAGNQIEQKLNSVWSQKELEIELRHDQSDDILRLYIRDEATGDGNEVNRRLTQPSQRSEGFRWFLSLYINLLGEMRRSESGYKILLLDDPAVHLHPEGKRDWLQTVEEIGKSEQIIYSSHSPYLIQKRHPSRIRTVEDRGKSGTKVQSNVFDSDQETFEPLRNALGLDLGHSPFLSERQILVEGPTEYYILSGMLNLIENWEQDVLSWKKLAIMPVRGAPDTVGKASWLESENIEYAILLDSDEEGRTVKGRIEDHHRDIEDDRVVLLEKPNHTSDVVIEDMFSPDFYVEAFNDEYREYTADFDGEFNPVNVEETDEGTWSIEGHEYSGTRVDKLLIDILEEQGIGDELPRNDSGEVELRKRQIAERIASRLTTATVDRSEIEHFYRIFGELDQITGN